MINIIKLLVVIVVVSLNGCALQPKDMASTPTKRLCDAYSAPLSPNLMDYAIKQELERRGQADCASPAAVAARQAAMQQLINIQLPVQQPRVYQPAPVAPPRTCTSTMQGDRLVTNCF
jgi:hypothetical protein